MTWAGSPSPAHVLHRAADAEREVEVGVHDDAGGADLALERQPAPVGDDPGAADRAAEARRRRRPSSSMTSRGPEPGAAADDARAPRPGPWSPGREAAPRPPSGRRRRRARRRAEAIEVDLLDGGDERRVDVDAPHARLQRGDERAVDHAASSMSSPPWRATVAPSACDRDRPGQQRPVEQVGQPGREVATVGRRWPARPRRSSARSGASSGRPGGRRVGRLLAAHELAWRRRRAPSTASAVPCADEQRPSAGLGHRLGAAERELTPARTGTARSQRRSHPVALDHRGVGPAGSDAVADARSHRVDRPFPGRSARAGRSRARRPARRARPARSSRRSSAW